MGNTLESADVEDQPCMCHTNYYFLTKHVLEPTRSRSKSIGCSSVFAERLRCNVNIQEPWGGSNHNKLHFIIKMKSDKPEVSRFAGGILRKGNYKEMRILLVHIDWNEKMTNKTATESWNILKSELEICEIKLRYCLAITNKMSL